MPAPLGTTPTKRMPRIEVYGLDDSPATRAAIRFFRDRRIIVRYVDLRKSPLTAAELRRLVDRIGRAALLEEGQSSAEDGTTAPESVGHIVARVRSDPRLLRLPIVVHDGEQTAGTDEPTWRRWLSRRAAGGR